MWSQAGVAILNQLLSLAGSQAADGRQLELGLTDPEALGPLLHMANP